MYVVDDRDAVIECTSVPPQSTGAPLPVVVASDANLMLSYMSNAEGDERTVLRFDGTLAHYCGPPNDEALTGHPLAARGLTCYGTFEVVNSSWIRSLELMNRVHPRHETARFSRLRHFIFTFHDVTFECVASDVMVAPWTPDNDAGRVLHTGLLDRK